MKLKDLMEAELKKMVSVLRLPAEERKELLNVINDAESEKAGAAIIEFCATVDKNNGYIRQEDSVSVAGTTDSIIADVKGGYPGLPGFKTGDIVKVAGISFVRLDDGKLVDLHHKK